jgi:hypothetical protein
METWESLYRAVAPALKQGELTVRELYTWYAAEMKVRGISIDNLRAKLRKFCLKGVAKSRTTLHQRVHRTVYWIDDSCKALASVTEAVARAVNEINTQRMALVPPPRPATRETVMSMVTAVDTIKALMVANNITQVNLQEGLVSFYVKC